MVEDPIQVIRRDLATVIGASVNDIDVVLVELEPDRYAFHYKGEVLANWTKGEQDISLNRKHPRMRSVVPSMLLELIARAKILAQTK